MSHLGFLVNEVVKTLTAADNAASEYQKTSALQCPPECGKCCTSPTVEATVLEMLPLAMELQTLGKAELIYSKLSENHVSKICVVFKSISPDGQKGRCEHYEFRPSVCRLFGFAGIKEKNGKTVLAACHVHKKSQPGTVTKCLSELGSIPPLFSDWHEVLQTIEPHLGSCSLPINKALKAALEITAYSGYDEDKSQDTFVEF